MRDVCSPLRQVSRREIIAWCLFDFANSILIINGGLYFPQWVVIDNSISDIWFNVTITCSSIALILTAPALGLVADTVRGNVFFLRWTSATMFGAALGLGIVAQAMTPSHLRGFLGLAGFFVIMYSYQLSLVFYNSMLGGLTNESAYSRLSGYGLAAGWLGGILGIFMVLPFVEGHVPWFQPGGRDQAFLPSALIYGMFVLPALALLPQRYPIGDHERWSFASTYSEVFRMIRTLPSRRGVLAFLISFFLFADAILTIQNNSTIYLDRVLGYSDNEKAYLFLLLLAAAAVGGVFFGTLADRMGVKRVLVGILLAWICIILVTAPLSGRGVFAVCFGVIGLLFGGTWTLARALLLILVSKGQHARYFGIYSSFERVASLIGPLVWSAPVALLPETDSGRYRIALVLMGAMILLGLVALNFVRVPRLVSLSNGGRE